MADAAVVEKIEVPASPAATEKKPFEKLFERDHPELIVDKPVVKDAKKSEFEKNLNKVVKEVVEPKVEEKESEEVKQPSESDDVTPADKDVEEPSKEEDKPAQTVEDKVEDKAADVDDVVKSYADKNGITVEKAKAEVEEFRGIAEKYKNDPIELAKAYKNMQSAFDKQKATIAQDQQARTVNSLMADAESFVKNAEKANAPKWIESYREQFPAKSDIMTDAAILEECRQLALNQVRGQMQTYQVQLKGEASAKRDQLIKELGEKDRHLATELGQALKNFPDTQIMEKAFNFQDLVRWARGSEKTMQKMIKEAEDRGFKKAQAGEILGEVRVAKSPSRSNAKPKENRPAGESLSSFEKQRAREMFGSAYDNDEERYAAFVDVVKSRKK